MSIPFHKQTSPDKQAGQVVFSIKPELYLSDSHKHETTLAQYIARKQEEPKRITFAEWSKDRHGYDLTQHYFVMDSADMLECWNAALKEGKL